MRLQYMDEAGNALLDLNWDDTDAILEARQTIAAILMQPVRTGPLKTVFFHFEPLGESVADSMLDYARQLLISIDSQVGGVACAYVCISTCYILSLCGWWLAG